jgi:hypothetical protein
MKTTEFLKENSIIAQEADTMHKDHEVQMARSQMYNSANAAIEIHKLLKNISEMEGIEGWVASKLTLANQYLESVRDYLKYEQVSQEPEMMEFVSEAADYALKKLVENSDAVHSAITRRIANQHPELLQAYGPEIVSAAIDDVANWIGDVDEIGSSDVSGWVRQVAQMLEENPPEAFMKEARDGDTNFGSTVGHGSWVVYDGNKVKRFKTRDGAKAYAEKNGGKVASSEFYADNIQGKQDLAEEGYKDWSEKNPGKLNKQTADMYDRNTHRWGGDKGVPGAKEGGGKDELKTVDRKGNPTTNLATRIEKPEGVPKVSKKPMTSFGGGVGRSGGMGGTMDPSAVKSLIPNFESKQVKKSVKENASGGASSAGGIAVSMGGPGHKPTSGVPKKLGNAHKTKKVTVGKGVY